MAKLINLLTKTVVIILLLTGSVGVLSSNLANAQEEGSPLRVGYMNPQEILDQMPEKQKVERKLQQLAEEKRGQLEEQTIAFQKKVSEFQQNQDNMSEQQINQREKELQKEQQKIQQFRQSIQQQLQRRRSKMLEPIFSKIDKAIEAVAEERNLTFVINETTSSGNEIVYYSSDAKMDITNDVMSRLDTQQQ